MRKSTEAAAAATTLVVAAQQQQQYCLRYKQVPLCINFNLYFRSRAQTNTPFEMLLFCGRKLLPKYASGKRRTQRENATAWEMCYKAKICIACRRVNKQTNIRKYTALPLYLVTNVK